MPPAVARRRPAGIASAITSRSGVAETIKKSTPAQKTIPSAVGQGTFRADILVSAHGGLSEPSVPDLPGLEDFEGTVFHSAQWDHDHDLRGERVAVIGTGASAIQIVPKIQPEVGHLTLLQRTPAWVLPHTDRPVTSFEKRLYRRVPALQRLWRLPALALRGSLRSGILRRVSHSSTGPTPTGSSMRLPRDAWPLSLLLPRAGRRRILHSLSLGEGRGEGLRPAPTQSRQGLPIVTGRTEGHETPCPF